MKKYILLSIIFAAFSSAYATTAPEVLSIGKLEDHKSNDQKFILISNSVRKGYLDIQTDKKLSATLSCDSKATVREKVSPTRTDPRPFVDRTGTTISFKLTGTTKLSFPTNVNECLLSVWNSRNPNTKLNINLYKDEYKHTFLKSLNNSQEDCNYRAESDLLNIEKLFLSNSWPMMSCMRETEKVEILSDSKESFLLKMETLLGQKPDVSFIDNQNPYAPLDFSKAPKLDAIFLSTLLYRRDFSGTVMARLLKFHAKRGTLVNIIGTGYMHDEKSKSLLRELTNFSGNIRVQEYKYHSTSIFKWPNQFISDKFRNIHMKMLVTLGEKREDNKLIIGGRNIHDGFLFSERPDFSDYPEINQFPEDESYAYWQDLELRVTSRTLAKSVYLHLLQFWNRDIKSQKVQDILSPNPNKRVSSDELFTSDNSMMRHFVSIPFNDDHALEKLYVEMIDSAENSIQLSTPYLRPTKKIMEAFERAASRGIDISIQTRINLEGDTQAWLYEETNKAAINDLFEKVKLYEWLDKSILHTKMIIIDEKIAFFGSVNLSRRSFIQDIEHGLIIRDADAVKRLSDIFVDYTSSSRLIKEKESRAFWASLVISLVPNEF